MSEYDKPIKEWNVVTDLRNFINTNLILTEKEEAILNFLYENYLGLPVQIPECTKYKPNIKYRTCIRCGEIKPVDLFDGLKTICKECRRLEKK
jgi:hypothetical protein